MPYTIFQIVNHMIYWQDYILEILAGGQPTVPAHAIDSWPGSEVPQTEAEWNQTVERFLQGVDQAIQLVETSDLEEKLPNWHNKPRLEALRVIPSHNSYHLGQVVLLRRMLGSWPPPGGGDTW